MWQIIHTSNHEIILGKAAATFSEKLTRKHTKASFFIVTCVQSRNHYGTIMALSSGPGAVVLHESFYVSLDEEQPNYYKLTRLPWPTEKRKH